MLIGMVLFCSLQAQAAPGTPPEPGNTNLVLEVRQTFSFMAGSEDPGPILKLYADGTALAHFPVYMKDAGDYEIRLSRGRWQALWRQFDQDNMLTFDEKATRKAMRDDQALRRQQAEDRGESPVLRHATDPETVMMTVHHVPGARRPLPEPRVIHWQGLISDSNMYPGVGSLQGLRRSVDALFGVGKSPDRMRLRPDNGRVKP